MKTTFHKKNRKKKADKIVKEEVKSWEARRENKDENQLGRCLGIAGQTRIQATVKG